MRLPTTKQLQYFVALVDTEHFGRAAEQSHVSQSAFSTAIRELETALGAQLVDRTNRQVTITAVGQAVATQARLCLRDLEELVDMAGGERPPLSTELQLGVIPTIAPFVLPEILPEFGMPTLISSCSSRRTRVKGLSTSSTAAFSMSF